MEEINGKETRKPALKERINFNTFAALFFILFSVIFYLLIPSQIPKPRFFMGRALVSLQPTLFPRLTMAGILFLSIWYLIESFHLRERNLFRELGQKKFMRVLVTFLVFVGYVFLFIAVGFVVSSMILVGVLALYYGYRKFIFLIPIIIGIPLAVYFLFTRLLRISLPEFPLF